ncbi:hypothetical protein H5410_022967 [Solanum commersonii]|uniref:Uncharacterized protein n=1 Tax=Solanum commersonii TaxID=4109 RepID=A0A9J5ZJV0_SOLCO|nr:hypothetical protein H5410_022967 [Solanum commersonii]
MMKGKKGLSDGWGIGQGTTGNCCFSAVNGRSSRDEGVTGIGKGSAWGRRGNCEAMGGGWSWRPPDIVVFWRFMAELGRGIIFRTAGVFFINFFKKCYLI